MKFDKPTADEFPLIYDSWSRSFKKSPWAGCVTNDMWDQVSRKTMTDIIDRGADITVAVTPIAGKEDQFPAVRRVMGYAVYESERRVLHWLFVKRDYRGCGVGGLLLGYVCNFGADGLPDRWTYTHRTKASPKFLGAGFEWDPVSARVKG